MDRNLIYEEVECIICGNFCYSVSDYHFHNIKDHSLSDLSSAIIKLRGFPLPLYNLSEENICRRKECDVFTDFDNFGNLVDTFDLFPLMTNLDDEEIIELGPTEDCEDLMVHSRLIKNWEEDKELPQHIVSVNEMEILTDTFNVDEAENLEETNKILSSSNKPNPVLRAAWKSTIEIPDVSKYKEFCGTNNKYLMYELKNNESIKNKLSYFGTKSAHEVKNNFMSLFKSSHYLDHDDASIISNVHNCANNIECDSNFKKVLTGNCRNANASYLNNEIRCGSKKNYEVCLFSEILDSSECDLLSLKKGDCTERKEDILDHVDINIKVSADKQWTCPLCKTPFQTISHLNKHININHGSEPLNCKVCKKLFSSFSNLERHMSLHSKNIYNCPFCQKKFNVKYSYQKHLKLHSRNAKYFCLHCRKKFLGKKGYDKHMLQHKLKSNLGLKKWMCTYCNNIKTADELVKTQEVKSGLHVICRLCFKGYYKQYLFCSKKSNVKNNNACYSQCSKCGKWVLNLNRHVKFVHDRKMFVSCNFCGKVVTKGSLKSHKNRLHANISAECDHCGKIYKNIMCLREHLAKVKKENICKYCHQHIPQANWKEHIRKHQMACAHCGLSNFSTQEDLLAHLKCCFKCQKCGLSSFESPAQYILHTKNCKGCIPAHVDISDHSYTSHSEDKNKKANKVHSENNSEVNKCAVKSCQIIMDTKDLLSEHMLNCHYIEL